MIIHLSVTTHVSQRMASASEWLAADTSTLLDVVDQITNRPLVSCDICTVLLNGLHGVVVVTSFDKGPLWAYC